MQKLPEVPEGKKGLRMRKRKKASSWQRGTGHLSLSGCDQRIDNTILLSGIWAPCIHLWTWRWLIPLPSSSSFSVSIMLKYTRPTNELQTNPYWTLTNLQKKTNPYESSKYQMRTNTCMKRLTYFWHLNWRIQPFQCIQEKLPHP